MISSGWLSSTPYFFISHPLFSFPPFWGSYACVSQRSPAGSGGTRCSARTPEAVSCLVRKRKEKAHLSVIHVLPAPAAHEGGLASAFQRSFRAQRSSVVCYRVAFSSRGVSSMDGTQSSHPRSSIDRVTSCADSVASSSRPILANKLPRRSFTPFPSLQRRLFAFLPLLCPPFRSSFCQTPPSSAFLRTSFL
ncbi:hypothetical protein TGVEG_201215 [Toxoplasma gondii VEG]|uniref:Uncharacterized protein n=1 Tax=Toxoplasma gondii (strain ATCC 50861 / VEG) TaxID=432359 RepID=V5BBN5_TOXGV|nr:hypothetical protein TGVEG_201215 [Toxoplasma gondii VEG]